MISYGRGFDRDFLGDRGNIIRIKIRHLKGENKWESSGKLDSNGLDFGSAQSRLKERINCSGTEYSIFLKEKAYPNVGN